MAATAAAPLPLGKSLALGFREINKYLNCLLIKISSSTL